MLQFDILGLIPQSLKRQALDTLVDFVSEQARKYASEEISARIKKLRSDAAFNQAFEEGLRRAIRRFVQEYEVEDEDLAGFKRAWAERDYRTIVQVAQRLPKAVLQEDPGLLMYYDNVLMWAEQEPVQGKLL